MSLNKPTKCKNCGKENAIWWEETWRPGIKRPRPYDIDNYHTYPGQPDKWWHECKPNDAQGMDKPNTDYKTKPILHQCVFEPCEFELIYNPQKGYHCEGGMEGDRHWCLHMPKNYEFDPEHPGQKRLKPDLWQKAQEYNRKLQELREKKDNPQHHQQQHPPTTTAQKTLDIKPSSPLTPISSEDPDIAEIKQSLKEIALILQGIAAQIKTFTDNQEVGNKYLRISKDTLLEWKEEMAEMARNPKVAFESGRDPITIGDDDDDDDDEDIYDEIADQDDTTEEGGDIGGFKPSK